MLVVATTFLASVSTGATAGLWVLGVWWRFAAMLAATLGLWVAVASMLLDN